MKTNSNILSRKIIETQLKIYVRERVDTRSGEENGWRLSLKYYKHKQHIPELERERPQNFRARERESERSHSPNERKPNMKSINRKKENQ